MAVELQPSELGFRRPFDREVTEVLTLTNANSSPVAFKVKTTAPKQYCVRPNSGTIPSGRSAEVQVLLQAMKEQPPPEAKCRDKFLVQSVVMSSEDDASNLPTFWQSVEKTNKSSIQEKKIRVNFLPPNADGATINGAVHPESDEPPAYTSPSPRFGSPAAPNSTNQTTTTQDTIATVKSSTTKAVEATGVAGAAAAVANAVPTSSDDLKEQLATAQAQISKLKNQLADPQLRQRKVQEATEKMQTVVQQTNESGVPLQIVAGLCLLSFLIAYLFF